MTSKITARDRRYLAVMYPEGTICMGQAIGEKLAGLGYLREAKWGRWGLTQKARDELAAAREQQNGAVRR